MSEDDEPSSRGREVQGGGFRGWLRGLLGGGGQENGGPVLEDLLDSYAERLAQMDPDQRRMLLNLLTFNERLVDDVMVPRAEIDAVEADSGLGDLIDRFRAVKHSRLPVYRDTLDDIAGFVHIKDVVDYWHADRPFDMKTVVREAMVVPPSMRAIDLLQQMRKTRIHMAIVVDEYGGTDGLVTIEDLVEEVVGDIVDEHEQEEIGIREMPDGTFEIDARTEIEEFDERFAVQLLEAEDDEDVETLAGFVFQRLGRIPRPGGRLALPRLRLEIEVLEVDPRRIRRLRLRRQEPGTELAASG